MSTAPTAGYVVMLDERSARLHLAALDALERELLRVAPTQLRAVKLARADLVRCLQAHSSTGCATATAQVQSGAARGNTHRREGNGVSATRDLLSVSEVARQYGISAAYVRRMAPKWNGTQVAGRWLIPTDHITTRRRTNG